jgi:hypothetical protein
MADPEVIEPDDDDTTDDDVTVEESELESESEESTDKERNSKELLTREKVSALMENDPLQNVVVGIFDQIVDNVEKGKSAAKVNTDSYAAALSKYEEAEPEEFASWRKRDEELDAALTALKQKVADHKSALTASTEQYREVADVDLGSVNERHRKMKVSLFNFLTAAGVSDADSAYRIPELPAAVRQSTGWAPRLGRVVVNGSDIPFAGKNPTLTDLNRTLNIKGDAGSGARWAELFGSRDVPTSGLSCNRTINGKNYRVQIFPQA